MCAFVCRNVFGVLLFLCIWHVLRAMTKRVWQLLERNSKADFEAIMLAVHQIMYMKLPDSLSYGEKLQKVQQAFSALRKKWAASKHKNYKNAAEYFEYWEGKLGALLACSMPTSCQHHAMTAARKLCLSNVACAMLVRPCSPLS